MSNYTVDQQLYAQKRVKKIKGFYSHLAATFVVLPFIIFVNLYTFPQFHWFWFAVIGWGVGLLIHTSCFFIDARFRVKEDWTTRRVNQIMESSGSENEDFSNEKHYVNAKKRIKEIKGFYAHLFVTLAAIPIIVFVNLKFVPGFHFFWLAIGGIAISIVLHWFGLYGFEFLGLGRDWEERKMKEILKK